MARWGEEKTLNFICLYRDHDCLWNVHSPMYKNKLARENAYHSLITSFGDTSLTLKSVKIKIKNLRTIYHSELKKVKDFIRSGEGGSIYKPSLSWFNEMHSFLSDSVEYRENINNEVENKDNVADNSSDLPSQDAVIDRSHDATLQPAHKSSHINLDSPSKPNNTNNGTIPSTKLQSNPQSTKFKECSIYGPKLKQRKLGCKRRHENDDAISNALQRLEHISSAVNSTQQTLQDEFHFFALSVAAQLRTLPLRTAVETQSKLQSILSAARLSSIPVASSSSCIHDSPDQPTISSEVHDTNSHGISIEIISENIKQESDNESQIWEKAD